MRREGRGVELVPQGVSGSGAPICGAAFQTSVHFQIASVMAYDLISSAGM